MMTLQCFGKYGPYPKANCACSCYMLKYDGKNIVIDLGCGSLSRVFAAVGAHELDAVLLSHLHADHMGDMLTLRYALDAAKRMGKLKKPLAVYMPAEPETEAKLIASNKNIEAHYIKDGSTVNICGMDVSFARMPHAIVSYAMSFCADGRKFVYSGDTSENEALTEFTVGADLFLVEAGFLSANKPENAVHLTAAEAARTGRDAGVRRLLLTHVFPEYDESELQKEAAQYYPEAHIVEELRSYEV